jgi:uncharacterized protein YkwD
LLGTFAPAAAADRTLSPPLADTLENVYLAPIGVCPAQNSPGAVTAAQIPAMRCMVNWARHRRGLAPLRVNARLDRSARMRAAEIRRCNQFSHTPCGDAFTHVFAASGYLHGAAWRVGENLAWGAGALGSARTAVAWWLASPPHRANLFGRSWRDFGVAMLKADALFGASNVTIWVVQFGRRG